MTRSTRERAVTFDMLRSFDSLARTLSLSRTSQELGLTRQTVRRQISSLEDIKGAKLFLLERNSLQLTQHAESALPGARSLLRQARFWSRPCAPGSSSQYLERAHMTDSAGNSYYSQQHPVSSISLNGNQLMQRTLAAWGSASAMIASPEMERVRPFLVLYRRSAGGWVCVEVGEKSAYAKWFGWKWSKSAVGRLSEDDMAGDDFNSFIADAYERIYGEGGVRLDHLFANLPREVSDQTTPVSFQRLLMSCVFPDYAPALAVLVTITRQVEISDLPPEDAASVSDELISEFSE